MKKILDIYNGKNIVIVSHAANVIALMRALVNDIDAECSPPVASITKLTKNKFTGKWEIQ